MFIIYLKLFDKLLWKSIGFYSDNQQINKNKEHQNRSKITNCSVSMYKPADGDSNYKVNFDHNIYLKY